MDGELLAEYAANAAPASPQKEYGYRSGQLLITASNPTRLNVALSANGAVATASSYYDDGTYTGAPSSTNDGEHQGINWGHDGGWNDAVPAYTFPDWLQITFNGTKNIDEIDVYTLQDNYTNPTEPSETMTFSQYGLTGYEVQYWNGSSWVDVPGGNVTGNNRVWRKFTFSQITTSQIRVLTLASSDGYSRLTEVEAYQVGGSSTDIEWLINDQLGTPRMVVDESGTRAGVKRHDYLPFGEEAANGCRKNEG